MANKTHMKNSGIDLLTYPRNGALAALLLGFGALPAFAQDDPMDRDPSARDVALTPLGDLNLDRDPIPEILLEARAAPYDDSGLEDCSDVRRMVGDLDAVLGDDYDTYTPTDDEISPTNIAQRVVGSFIPFRGIIREISGANEHVRDFREAIAAGLLRRAYLKGRGQEMGCPYPASPAPPELVARLQAMAAEAQQESSENETAKAADDGTTFVSRPVIQPTD
mgnify:CR=1 FL=1